MPRTGPGSYSCRVPARGRRRCRTGRGRRRGPPRRSHGRRSRPPAHAVTAARASPEGDPHGARQGQTRPAVMTPSAAVASWRRSPARDRRRRSQPRTVAAGTPSSAPSRTLPVPCRAAAAAARAITPAPSARRGAIQDGSRICVARQDRHRPRGGRTTARSPSCSRTARSRPWPHVPRRPPHDRHTTAPEARSASEDRRRRTAARGASPLLVMLRHSAPARAGRQGQLVLHDPSPAAAPQPERPLRPGRHGERPCPSPAPGGRTAARAAQGVVARRYRNAERDAHRQ
jgi:hypothetical protein